jgi:hypothetical protein
MQARLAITDTRDAKRQNSALVALRTQLEAKLLAHRCGWRTLDDIRVKKLELALQAVLAELGQPDPAEELIRRNQP